MMMMIVIRRRKRRRRRRRKRTSFLSVNGIPNFSPIQISYLHS